MLGIIGGSGFEKFDGFEIVEELSADTPFGKASSGFKKVKIDGVECLFLSRHGSNHELLPSEINFRANVFNFKKHGAKAVVSFSAVGSLAKEFKPGDMVVPTQYIDRTKGLRNHTFLGEGLVGHVSLAKPICHNMLEFAMEKSKGKEWDSHFKKTYVCIEGPYFSTVAESKWFCSMGADIIGMTHFPEFALMREAGLAYLPCCFITDYDCWDESIEHVTLQEVIKVMRGNNSKAFSLAKDLVQLGNKLWENSNCSNEGLKTGLMTSEEMRPKKSQEWLSTILN